MRLILLLPALLTTFLAGCRTTVEQSLPNAEGTEISHARPTRMWAVREAGAPRGAVIRYEEVGSNGFYYVVQNTHGQDLGIVDSLGRAYRHRPHQDEPDWMGTGTILDGVIGILGTGPETSMVETEVEPSEEP